MIGRCRAACNQYRAGTQRWAWAGSCILAWSPQRGWWPWPAAPGSLSRGPGPIRQGEAAPSSRTLRLGECF